MIEPHPASFAEIAAGLRELVVLEAGRLNALVSLTVNLQGAPIDLERMRERIGLLGQAERLLRATAWAEAGVRALAAREPAAAAPQPEKAHAR